MMLIVAFMCAFYVNVQASSRPDFNVMIRASDEAHLVNGRMEFSYLGISTGKKWAATKFQISIDGGKTWLNAECLNGELKRPSYIMNTPISEYEYLFNYQPLKKVLYYGYSDYGWDKTKFNEILNTYPITKPASAADVSLEQWTDDLAYVVSHLALSYAYYHDVMGLSETEASDKAFYDVNDNGRKVAKAWYDYLMSKPDTGVRLTLQNGDVIDGNNIKNKDTFNIDFDEYITIEGSKLGEEAGGRIEFTVPVGMECVVEGKDTGLSNGTKVYPAGKKLTLGTNQKFKFRLVEAVSSIEDVKIDFYDNFSIIKVDGGLDEDGKEYQDIAALYKAKPQTITFKFKGGKLNLTKKLVDGDNKSTYYFGIFKENGDLFDIVEMKLNGKDETTVTVYVPISSSGSTIYTIRETDKDGKVLTNSDTLEISGDKTDIRYTSTKLENSVTITNKILTPPTPEPEPEPLPPSPQTGIEDYVYLLGLGVVGCGILVGVNRKYKLLKGRV